MKVRRGRRKEGVGFGGIRVRGGSVLFGKSKPFGPREKVEWGGEKGKISADFKTKKGLAKGKKKRKLEP